MGGRTEARLTKRVLMQKSMLLFLAGSPLVQASAHFPDVSHVAENSMPGIRNLLRSEHLLPFSGAAWLKIMWCEQVSKPDDPGTT